MSYGRVYFLEKYPPTNSKASLISIFYEYVSMKYQILPKKNVKLSLKFILTGLNKIQEANLSFALRAWDN